MKTSRLFFPIFLIFLSNNISYIYTKSRSLSRHKRYVVFPEGSSMTVAFCVTMNLLEYEATIWSQLVNFGINYDLPNRTIYQLYKSTETKDTARRRYRRDLYGKVEIILNAMGLDGKSCVYKALCEVVQILKHKGENMLEEIIRRLFHFPLDQLHISEPPDHHFYHQAHKLGYENTDCNEIYSNCHVSLINMLLGYEHYNFD